MYVCMHVCIIAALDRLIWFSCVIDLIASILFFGIDDIQFQRHNAVQYNIAVVVRIR